MPQRVKKKSVYNKSIMANNVYTVVSIESSKKLIKNFNSNQKKYSRQIVNVKQDDFKDLKNKPEKVDPTALNIHGKIHKKVPHARCILHVHSKYATALSALKDPTLPPIDQNTMRFYNRVSVYNEYGGMGFEEESKKMATALGNKKHMLMANHGIMTTGETVSDGFDALYYFEKSAETYLTALSTNKELNIASHEVAEKTAQEWATYPSDLARAHLDQIRIILDKEDPDYKN